MCAKQSAEAQPQQITWISSMGAISSEPEGSYHNHMCFDCSDFFRVGRDLEVLNCAAEQRSQTILNDICTFNVADLSHIEPLRTSESEASRVKSEHNKIFILCMCISLSDGMSINLRSLSSVSPRFGIASLVMFHSRGTCIGFAVVVAVDVWRAIVRTMMNISCTSKCSARLVPFAFASNAHLICQYTLTLSSLPTRALRDVD
jgi:hypothetical protein